MAAGSSVFPAFVRAEYDPGGGAFAQFQRDAAATGDRVRRQFEADFSEIQRIAKSALSVPRNAAGSLDVNAGQYREAAAAAQTQAAALREIATAAERAAIRNGDNSEATRLYVQSARAAALEAEQGARAATQQATAMDRLQAELNQTASSTTRVIQAQGGMNTALYRGADGIRANRFAMIGIGQQLQDFTVGLVSGQNAAVVLAQQLPQLAFAATGFQGVIGRVAAFLSGPWGFAVFGAVTAIGFLTAAFFENEKAAKAAELGADGLSQAQSVLGEMFDLTSGKLERQNDLLILNARLTAINLRAEAEAARASARSTFGDIGERSWMGRVAGLAGGFTGDVLGARGSAQQRLYDDLLARRVTLSEAAQQAEKMDFSGLAIDKQTFLKALADTASGAYKSATADLIDRSLDTGVLASGLRRDPPNRRTRRPRDSAREIESLGEFSRDAADRIANIAGRFADQPKLIEQARKATAELADIQDDVIRKNERLIKLTGEGLPNFDDLLASITEAGEVIQEGMVRPYTDFLRGQEQSLEIQELITAGREAEAEALSIVYQLEERMGPLTEARKQAILDGVVALREEARATEVARQKASAYLDALGDIRSNIEATIEGVSGRGLKSIGDFISGLRGTLTQLSSRVLTERLVGPVIRQIEDEITGLNPAREAARRTASAFDETTEAATTLADTFVSAAATISGAVAGGPVPTGRLDGILNGLEDALAREGAANDNEGQDIVVTGRRLPSWNVSPVDFINRTMGDILERLGGPLAKEVGEKVGTAIEGAGYGTLAGGLLLGSRGSSTGSAIGGALGNVAGKEIGKQFGDVLGKFASFAGPLGSIVGGLAGGLIGNLFGGTKRGSSTIAVDAGGNLVVASTTGNSRSRREASMGAADSAISTIERIAEALGATVLPGVGSVSIGMRKDTYRVDPSGRGRTKLSKGAIEFQDAEAAVRAATLDLIKDGILGGLRASTQRLLQGAKDLDLGIEKALKFESVFVRLKEFTDPVGAAVDALNKEFEGLKRIFAEAGASAEEYAKLEELYGLERERVIREAGENTVSALKDLLADLQTGDNGLSLRDRIANARAKYDPLAADIAAGRAVDADAFAEAARNVLDLQRQLSGSQSAYFDLYNEIVALTQKALGASANSPTPGANLPSPFGPAPGAVDTAPVVGSIEHLRDYLGGILTGQLSAVNDNLGRLISTQLSRNSFDSSFANARLQY